MVKDNKDKLKMTLAPEAEFAKFASVARINHSAFEFYIDFGQFIPDTRSFKAHTRIVITPFHAKKVAEVLTKSVADYEKRFGKVPEVKIRQAKPVELRKPTEPSYIG